MHIDSKELTGKPRKAGALMTISESIKLFLDSRKRGTSGAKKKSSESTIEIYDRNLEAFETFLMNDCAGVLKYQDMKRLHVVQFLDWLDHQEKTNVWSKATCIQMLRCLRTYFRWVDVDEDCQEDGLKGFSKYLPVIGKCPRRTDIPQTTDLSKFRDSFDTKNRWGFRDYVATSLMLDNGIRVGEVCNLQLTHMRLDEQILFVDGKTGIRAVPISKEMAKLFKGWLRRRDDCKTAVDSPYVFVSKYGPRLSENGLGQRFRKLTKKYGLPRVTAHSMRHAMATNYLTKGGDMEKLRLMIGHSSYAMLQEYLHLSKIGGKSMQEELEKVSLLKAV